MTVFISLTFTRMVIFDNVNVIIGIFILKQKNVYIILMYNYRFNVINPIFLIKIKMLLYIVLVYLYYNCEIPVFGDSLIYTINALF